MIPILYNSLEIFMTTFEELSLFDGRSQQIFDMSVYDQRNEFLKQISIDLNAVSDCLVWQIFLMIYNILLKSWISPKMVPGLQKL